MLVDYGDQQQHGAHKLMVRFNLKTLDKLFTTIIDGIIEFISSGSED